jgi:lipid-binding SYLF domain-containing protein
MKAMFRIGLMGLAALLGVSMTTVAKADSGTIAFNVVKAGFVFGGSAGTGVLTFHGKRYPISIGGLSWGFTFGASETRFTGRVTRIHRPSDVAGVYAAAGAGVAAIRGAQAIVLQNPNGATLSLVGRQAGLIVSADLNGMAISLR